jgi:hypothetical protein
MTNSVKVLKFNDPIEIDGYSCVYLYKEREFSLPLKNHQMLFSYMTDTGFRVPTPIKIQVDINGIENSDEAFWGGVATQLSLPSYTLISQAEFQSQITPQGTVEEKLDTLREIRNIKLAETDWWVLPDRTPTDEQLAYRQALRDITNTYNSLEDVVWPTKP